MTSVLFTLSLLCERKAGKTCKLLRRRTEMSRHRADRNSGDTEENNEEKLKKEQEGFLQCFLHPVTPHARLAAARYFRKLVAGRDKLYVNFMGKALVTLNRCLILPDNPELQLDSAWIVTNLLCGNMNETHRVVRSEAPKNLLILARQEGNVELRDQAIWALSNIAGDCVDCRARLFNLGFFPTLSAIIHKELQALSTPSGSRGKYGSKIDTLKVGIWALCNLCRVCPSHPLGAIQARDAAEMAAETLSGGTREKEVCADAAWALAYLADSSEAHIPLIVATGVIPILLNNLEDEFEQLHQGSLRAVGNIVMGGEEETQAVIDADGILFLHRNLHQNSESCRREALWALSNIAAGTQAQVQAVLNSSDLLRDVADFIALGSLRTMKEALWIICNASSGGTVAQNRRLFAFGFFPILIAALSRVLDPNLTRAVWSAAKTIGETWRGDRRALLQILGGVEGSVQTLLNHSDPLIRSETLQLLPSLTQPTPAPEQPITITIRRP